jgi:cobalt-zinc-cadmium efflux system outer membrane protein
MSMSSARRPLPAARLPRAGWPFALVTVLVALGACGAAPRGAAAEVPPADQLVVAPPAGVPAPPGAQTGMAALVDAARRLHPTARAVAAAQRAADARSAQAGVWANPQVELSYGRTRPRLAELATDHPYGATVSQRLEWWGKRRARVAAAQADAVAGQAEADAALLDLEVEVRLAAIACASAREGVTQAAAQAALARELLTVVGKRHAAGDIDLGEAARVQVEASTARLRLEAATRAAATALAVLRTWCGDDLPDDLAIGDALGDAAAAEPATPAVHPRLRAAQEAERAAGARSEAERQARYPDLTIGVFGEREWEKDTYGMTVGIEIPLWDRNAAGIALAEAERERLAANRQLAALALRRERAQARADLDAARAEVAILADEALPAANDAVRLRGTAFASGDASLADVLDARRALVALQSDLLAARRRCAEARVRLSAANTPGSQP